MQASNQTRKRSTDKTRKTQTTMTYDDGSRTAASLMFVAIVVVLVVIAALALGDAINTAV